MNNEEETKKVVNGVEEDVEVAAVEEVADTAEQA